MLKLQDVRYQYPDGKTLSFPDIHLSPGQSAALVGPSGSGKSTLMHLIGGMLTAQAGSVMVDGTDITTLDQPARDQFRGEKMGLVLQQLGLLPNLTLLDNLLLAQYLSGTAQDVAHCTSLLVELGLSEALRKKPAKLSQGQRQRAAIARAIVNKPVLLMADEPTAALDDASAEAALNLLMSVAARHGASLLVATHDVRAKARFTQVWTLGDAQ
ncbi:ABC transporter ATP-binding protein [Leeia oryzae]|uniref:ABC transporter ATP-binding protein n=1 Tax=Leeia oryzae TaxID=356662 RepID=UPI000365A476|nr:ATP-binding cassette domain-containing protein [Leeia oryzae]